MSFKQKWRWFHNFHNYQKWPGLLAQPGSCLPGLWPWFHPLSCLVINHTECFTSNKQIENIHETTDTKEVCWFLSLSVFFVSSSLFPLLIGEFHVFLLLANLVIGAVGAISDVKDICLYARGSWKLTSQVWRRCVVDQGPVRLQNGKLLLWWKCLQSLRCKLRVFHIAKVSHPPSSISEQG